MRNALNFWLKLNGVRVLNAVNAEIQIIARVKHHIRDVAPSAKLKNRQLPEPYFTIASFQSARLSI